MFRNVPLTLAPALTGACSPFPSPDALEGPTCASGVWDPGEALRASLGADHVLVCAPLHGGTPTTESGAWPCDSVSDREGCVYATNACLNHGGSS